MACVDNKSKVIIFYDSEGANTTSKKEAELLSFFIEKNGGYTCQTDDEIWKEGGDEKLKTTHNIIHKNDRIIILITDQSPSKGWFTFAVLSALENIAVDNHMRLLVAYKGNRKEDVGFLKTGLLALTPKAFVDINKDINKWQGFERLLEQLKTPVCLDEELPAGNLHLGLVHSHLSGYLCYVAEEFAKRQSWMEKCDGYRKQQKLLIGKFLLVVPKTCAVPQCLPSNLAADIVISNVDKFEFERLHAGKERKYVVTINKIKHADNEVYVCAQVPTVLTAISHLAKQHLGQINVAREHQRFCQSYQQIIDAKGWHDFVEIVQCEDENDIPVALFKAATTNADKVTGNGTTQINAGVISGVKKTSVYISCNDMDNDSREEIEIELDNHHIRHDETNTLGRSMLSEGDNREGWIIVIVSKESLKSEKFSLNLMKYLTADVDEGKLSVLPVLRSGVNISDVPRCIQWVTWISENEKYYKNWIVRIVSGAPVDIGRALPAGDVIPGLCWAYFLNYLKIVLTTSSINKTILEYLTNNDLNCGCIRKLIVVWVKSCDMENTLDVVANKCGGRRKITNSDPVHVTTNSLGGQIGRPFALNMFRYTDESHPGNQKCFLAEYCTPMHCVQTMEKGYAGISATTKQGMGESFKQKFNEIMSRRKMKILFANFKVSFVLFDDTNPRTRLMDLLEPEILDPECEVIKRN